MWFLKVLRMLFITLDWAVYNLASLLYELFVMISETGIFRTEAMRTFANRLYFFLGLIMIFKVSISIIQYIMNPDAVKDAKLGAGKLLKNIIVILLGIVLVPYVFEMAFSLQRIVLKDNVLGNLILGLKYSGNEGEDAVKTAGNMMAFSTFTAFFHPDGTLSDIGETCETNPVENGQIIGDCGQLGDALGGAKDQFIEAYDKKQMGKLYKMDIYNATMSVDGEDVFVFTYSYLVTTIAGGFLCYLLLIFCIDIAVRSVKLGFLQLIAPIPLIAKIDPKKGDDVFNKWVKECVSTYLNLFIRLAALFFAIFIISLVGDGMFNVVTGDDVHNPFVFVFIIFGVLLFAKDLPKLIEQITGIKMSGDGLNLKKKVGGVPLLGGAALAAGGFAGRSAANLARGVGGAAGAVGKLGANKFKNSKAGQWLGSNDRWYSKAGTAMDDRIKAARQRAAAIGNKLNEKTGGALAAAGGAFGKSMKEIGRDAKQTGNAMLNSTVGGFGLGGIKQRIADRKSAIEANDAVRERAKSKLEQSEEYAKRKMNLERLSRAAEQAQSAGKITDSSGRTETDQEFNDRITAMYDSLAKEQTSFEKWHNVDGVNEYIDSKGAKFYGGKEDDEIASRIDNRDSVWSSIGYSVPKTAKEQDDMATNMKRENRADSTTVAQRESAGTGKK